MKKHSFHNIYIFMLVTLGVTVIACTKKTIDPSGPSVTYKITGSATAAQVVPASASAGTGNITGWFDETIQSFTYTIRWSNLWVKVGSVDQDTITKANLYGPAAAGQTGDSLRSINILPKIRSLTDSITNTLPPNQYFTDAQKQSFLDGKWYFMIHTKKYPNGIIRGQLNIQKN